MSLRRKIALWLCPELGDSKPEELRKVPFPEVDYFYNGRGWATGVPDVDRAMKLEAEEARTRTFPAGDNKALCETLKASQHASDAAWKAEVLEQLKAMNAKLTSITEDGNAMKVTILK